MFLNQILRIYINQQIYGTKTYLRQLAKKGKKKHGRYMPLTLFLPMAGFLPSTALPLADVFLVFHIQILRINKTNNHLNINTGRQVVKCLTSS